MNYFFGIKTKNIYSNITIPRFNNDGNTNKEYLLCKANIKNAAWNIEVLNNNKINDDFYLIEENISNNENIFFLAKQGEIDNFNKKKLINFNNFTDTSPSYRSNLKINLKNGGFSSYQSEYPFSKIKRRGSILSSISTLLNIEPGDQIASFVGNECRGTTEAIESPFNTTVFLLMNFGDPALSIIDSFKSIN